MFCLVKPGALQHSGSVWNLCFISFLHSVLHGWGDAVFAQTLIHAEGFISRWENRGMEDEKWRDVIKRGWMCHSCHRQQTIKACSPAASSQQTCQTRPDHSCWLEWAPHESLTETTAAFFFFCYRHILYQRHCSYNMNMSISVLRHDVSMQDNKRI